jgi:hypothetical protein
VDTPLRGSPAHSDPVAAPHESTALTQGPLPPHSPTQSPGIHVADIKTTNCRGPPMPQAL